LSVHLKPKIKPKNSPSPNIGDSSVFFKLIRLVNLAARPFNEDIGKRHDLSLNEWRVMVVLASHPGCTATDVVLYTGLDKMSVSRALVGLTKLSRVQRTQDPNDARRTFVNLSMSGSKLFTVISGSAAEREAVMFSGLSSSELQTLEMIVDHLTKSLTDTV
jgi:DNA-binding MarR family transcriptional regulator